MANKLLYLITEFSGYENFEKCLKLCDLVEFSELISINENTLNRMELYLQKKCSRMPLSERNELIGDKFANNPQMFKFSPGTRHRILTVIEKLEKIFMNPSFPISPNSIDELCGRILLHKNQLSTSVPLNSLKGFIHKLYLGMECNNNLLFESLESTKSNKTEIDNMGSVVEKKHESYPNIFQRMDSLRRGEIKSPMKIDLKDKENIASKSPLNNCIVNNNKRKLETSDSLVHSDEPVAKITKVFSLNYSKIPNKQIANTGLNNFNISKENFFRNNNHAVTSQLNQKLNDNNLTGKRKFAKEVKLTQNQDIQIKESKKNKKVENSDKEILKMDSEIDCAKSSQMHINRISKRLLDKNPITKLSLNTKELNQNDGLSQQRSRFLRISEVAHTALKKSLKKISKPKVPEAITPILDEKICSSNPRKLSINQKSNIFDRSLEPIVDKISNRKISSKKPSLTVKNYKPQLDKSIVQPIPLNKKEMIPSVRNIGEIGTLRSSNTNISHILSHLSNISIQRVESDRPTGSRKIQLSDYPFQLTESVKQKKTSKQVPKEQRVVFNNSHKSPNSFSVSQSSHIDYKLNTQDQSNFQKNVAEQKISINSIKDGESKTNNIKLGLEKPTLFGCKTMPDISVTDSEFSVEPQWQSSSAFITNRFINSTKHQQPTYKKYVKITQSQPDSDNVNN